MTAEEWDTVEVPTHPIKDGKWVALLVSIRDNATGEVRDGYPMEFPLYAGEQEPSDFIWRDGNYACDCNRRLFFGYAAGEKGEDIETECSDGKFSVQVRNRRTGRVFYSDFPLQ